MQIAKNIQRLITAPVNLISRAVNRPLKPRWLFFAITDRCNSRCKHCNIWQNTPTVNPLTPAEIEKTLSSPLFKNIEYILNTGGEPTTRGDLEQVFLAEHKALPNAKLQLSTNGLLPDRALSLVKFALNNDICIDVGLSLDGVGNNHDEIRGVPGNFNKAERLLSELFKLKEQNPGKLDITVGYVLSALSLSMLPEVRTYLQEKFAIEPFVQWYNEAPFYDNVGNTLTGKDELIQTVKSLDPEILGGINLKEMWLKWLKGKPIKFQCFAIDTFCVLKCDGAIAPCLSLWDAEIGNVRENSPEEVWKSKRANEVRRMVRKCSGCLNAWGTGWSWNSSYYPYLTTYLRHPDILARSLK